MESFAITNFFYFFYFLKNTGSPIEHQHNNTRITEPPPRLPQGGQVQL